MDEELTLLLKTIKSKGEDQFQQIKDTTYWKEFEDAWFNGGVKLVFYWISWLLVGTIFYTFVDFNGYFPDGFLFSVNVGYCIGWAYAENKHISMLFSIGFQLIGTWKVKDGLVYLIEASSLSNEEWSLQARRRQLIEERLKNASLYDRVWMFIAHNHFLVYFSMLFCMYLIFGSIWTHYMVGWSYISGLYFTVSSFATCGSHGLPHDTPGWIKCIAGVFVATGSPLMGMVMGSVATGMVASAREKKAQKVITSKLSSVEQETFEEIELFDHDGKLNREEYLLLTLLRLKVVDMGLVNEIYNRFDQLDVDKEGLISYADLIPANSLKENMSVPPEEDFANISPEVEMIQKSTAFNPMLTSSALEMKLQGEKKYGPVNHQDEIMQA